jgi:hypothetical protein
MANDLTEVIPQLLAQGLMALRQMAIMPQLVNRAYEAMSGPEGSTIDVPIPSAIAVQDVTPGATPPSTADIGPTSVPVALDRWKEAPFYLTDKDFMEIRRGTLPMIASEAVKALANEVDAYLLSLCKKFYGIAGTAGTVPFANEKTTDATALRAVLNKQLAGLDNRHVVLNPDAEGSALNVRAFQDASFGGGPAALMEGQINNKLGFRWWMDQNVTSHTAGTAADYLVNNVAGYAVGIKTVLVDTGTGTLNVGDIIKFAGHTQTYVVTASVGGSSITSISFEPGLVVAVANNVVVTGPGDTGGIGTHVLNPAFHRDAIAFATRPLEGSSHPGSIIESDFDNISGLTLRLEVTREHKRDRYSFDILYGGDVVRRELGARLLG